jgi:hypothetical protein
MDYGAQLHPLEYNADAVRDAIQSQRKKDGSSSSSSSSSGGGSSGSSSGSSKLQQATQQHSEQQQRKQEQQQQKQQQQQRSSAQRTAGSTVYDKDLARYSVALQPGNLVPANNSELMVNLNVQMSNALADYKHLAAIKLFDQLLDKGIQAAQQQQQSAGQQQQQPLLLPPQFRPDHSAFSAYCRAVAR